MSRPARAAALDLILVSYLIDRLAGHDVCKYCEQIMPRLQSRQPARFSTAVKPPKRLLGDVLFVGRLVPGTVEFFPCQGHQGRPVTLVHPDQRGFLAVLHLHDPGANRTN